MWFGAEGGELNYYFFYGPSLKKILSRYADLTGHMPLPPLWALGNQQSRWSYYPDTMVEEVVSEYRKRDLPLDVLHLDIDYMQGYRVFTWDTEALSESESAERETGKQGVKLITIVDPGVKHQPVAKSCGAQLLRSHRNSNHRISAITFSMQGLQKNYFQTAQEWRPVHSESLAGRKCLCRLHAAGGARVVGRFASRLHRQWRGRNLDRHERAV